MKSRLSPVENHLTQNKIQNFNVFIVRTIEMILWCYKLDVVKKKRRGGGDEVLFKDPLHPIKAFLDVF